jgi:hypothetical protein
MAHLYQLPNVKQSCRDRTSAGSHSRPYHLALAETLPEGWRVGLIKISGKWLCKNLLGLVPRKSLVQGVSFGVTISIAKTIHPNI